MTLPLLILIVVSVSLNSLAQIALRKAMLVAIPVPPITAPVQLAMHFAGNVYFWVGMVSFAGSILLWLAVLQRIQVSVAYPLASLGYVIVAVFSVLLLGENVTLWRAVGIGLICLGAVCIARTA